MTFARLARRDVLRNPLRAGLTVLAAAIGVLAFVFLQTVVDVFYIGAEAAQVDRLVVRNEAGFTQPLPLGYVSRIAAVPGVSAVTHSGWFGGQLGERRDEQFANFYVDQTTWLDVYDEFTAPPEQIHQWEQDPCGAMVGIDLARRYGWKVGDRVTLEGTIFPGEWTFTVRGIYRAARKGADTTVMAFGYRCINETLPESQRDRTGIISVRVDDPARSAQVAADIDAMFANSPFETRTESERAFQMGFIGMVSAILVAVQTVSFVVLLIILFVVANTMAMGVRERTTEFATLLAMGFRPRHVVWLVALEALVIGGLAALLGILAAPPVIGGFLGAVEAEFGAMPDIQLEPGTLILSAVIALAVALVAAALPALRVAKLPVAEGLRKVA